MHPLPRSLEPASGESLVSYLLRLGHRLNLPPLQLIRAAGWADRVQATHIPGSLLVNLTGPEAQGFARLTRQTAEEVSTFLEGLFEDANPGLSRPDVTARQVVVLNLVAQGMTSRAIGYRLHISARTVERHLENIYRRLGVSDRVSAVRLAAFAGIIPSAPSVAR